MVHYSVRPTEGTYKIFYTGFDGESTQDDMKHEAGSNPVPEMREALSQSWLIPDSYVNALCDAIQAKCDHLREGKPVAASSVPAQ